MFLYFTLVCTSQSCGHETKLLDWCGSWFKNGEKHWSYVITHSTNPWPFWSQRWVLKGVYNVKYKKCSYMWAAVFLVLWLLLWLLYMLKLVFMILWIWIYLCFVRCFSNWNSFANCMVTSARKQFCLADPIIFGRERGNLGSQWSI